MGSWLATPVLVLWMEPVPGQELNPDVVTGALPDGAEVEVSGTLRGLWHETGATTQLRRYAEIQAGDVIFDTDPAALVTYLPGQTLDGVTLLSGTVSLDTMKAKGARFVRPDGAVYTQRDIGDELADAWGVMVGGQLLLRTLLLRKAT
jgi:hypothetical protein